MLAFTVLTSGCVMESKYVGLDYYYVYSPPNIKPFTKNDTPYFTDENKYYTITFSLVGHEGVMIVPLEIKNKTGTDIGAQEYRGALYDGRDRLPLKLIGREDLETIVNQLLNPKGFSLSNPSIQGAFSSIDSLIKLPANSSLGNDVRNIANNYFVFRPVYAGSTRSGYLAFFHAFKLEYPLTLEIIINGKAYRYYFAPQKG